MPVSIADLLLTPRQRSRPIIRRADAARDAKDFPNAARLYERALRLVPRNGSVHVQAGHAHKEAGNFTKAEEHYQAAGRLMPDDADLALQFGHFYKITGRIAESERAYLRAHDLQPDWQEPVLELDRLYSLGWRPAETRDTLPDQSGFVPTNNGAPGAFDTAVFDALARQDGLVAELVPTPVNAMLHPHGERFDLRRLGTIERSVWGPMRTLRGVEAVRGFATSIERFTRVRLRLNGMVLQEGPVQGPYTLKYETETYRIRKYVFNEWVDFSHFQPGRYRLEIELVELRGRVVTHAEEVRIAAPLDPASHPEADALVPIDLPGDGSLEQRINAAPSVVRPAHRTLFATPPKAILIQRTDQLGDMVLSIPAMKRIRETFPEARLVGLLTHGNADFARTLGLFDEVLVVDFPDDPVNRRRIMPYAEQEKLRARLAPYKFDLAIDLSESSVSRPLLLLSGAPKLFGFREREFPFLTGGYEGNTRDRFNGMEVTGHSTKVLALADRLATLAKANTEVIRRPELSRDQLAGYGIAPGERYMVLHAGARIEYSRWPHFAELARTILARTGHKVVMFGNGPEEEERLPEDLRASDRFIFMARLLPFDDFDALLSFADAFVGNDSGPKHLASLRGVNVVSIHMARNNWAEWGQEQSGLIVSRRVPCAGCALYYEAEECGKEFACIRHIGPDEVFTAIERLLPAA